ncbi:MAG: phenylalanine--tRNA ligase subunit alpha [Candidatus Saccharimonadales bacterium]
MKDEKQLNNALKKIGAAENREELESLRLEFLGKKGKVTLALKEVGSLPSKNRAKAGQFLNKARVQIEEAVQAKKSALENKALEEQLKYDKLDLTAPGLGPKLGHLHPIENLRQELIELFWQAGFTVADGPEMETDWYVFEALNIPANHPARDMQDTFYLENGLIPRTHTSSIQIRHMEANKPPVRIIAPGKVYRNETEDATHVWAFNQIEGLVVDKDISLADLKGTLLYMLKGLFGEDAELRLRPNYFPYTEPSLEVDGRMNSESEWLELGGAGMVHPKVLRNVGLDPNEYSGFAFGFGLERLAAIKHGVEDIRLFWRPDLRFLEQF